MRSRSTVRRCHGLVLFLYAAIAVAGFAQSRGARDRHALVIGNGAYKSVSPLQNPLNDARDMAKLLAGFGFQVTTLPDAGGEQLQRGIEAFSKSLTAGDVALLFYAGHGIQVAGENYMIPVDFVGDDEAAVKYRCFNVDRARELMEKSGARLNILILDACRNNPLRAKTRMMVLGLAPMEAGLGTLIAYSTGPGQTAADGPQQSNGLFTGFLLKALREPVDMLSALRKAREEVYTASQGKQRPWIHEDLLDNFFLGGTAAPSSMTAAPAAPSATGAQTRTPKSDLMREGQSLFAAGKYKEALDAFEKARRTNADNPFAHNAAGAAYSLLGFNKPAIDCYNTAIGLKPDYAAAYYNRGRAYLREGNSKLAVEDFTWAIEQETDNPIHYPLRAKAQFNLRRYEDAMADYDRAIELNPGDHASFHGRALIHHRQGRYGEAIRDFTEALRQNPDFAQGYSDRAITFERMSAKREAEADRRAAEKLGAKK